MRGEKRRLQELATAERAARSRVGRAPDRAAAAAAGRGPGGAARGAEPREPAAADRVLRRLEHPGRGGRRLDGRLPGRAAEEGALPQVRRARARRAGRLRGAGRGRLAAVRSGRMRAPAPDDYDESFAATPNLVVIDGGKGQLAAVLEAMHAYDLPRVAVISLAKRIEEVFVPGPVGPDPARRATRPGSSCCSGCATRRTASRVGFHRQRRDAKARESIFDTLPGRRPGQAAGAAAALRLGRALPRRLARRSWRACPASRPRRRATSTPSCTRRAGPRRAGDLKAVGRSSTV